MPQITLASLADTSVSPFSPTPELSLRQRPAAASSATSSKRAAALSAGAESDRVARLRSSHVARARRRRR